MHDQPDQQFATVAADLEILSVAYARRWSLNGPGHENNARLAQLESAASEAHAALTHFLAVVGK